MAVRTSYVGTQFAGDVLTSSNFSKLPGGWIGYVEVTADQTGISSSTTDLTSLTLTVTVGASRRIRVTGYARVIQQTSAANPQMFIRNSGGTILQTASLNLGIGETGTHHMSVILTPSTGSNLYKLSLSTAAGTVDLEASSIQPAWIMVEDIGPSA